MAMVMISFHCCLGITLHYIHLLLSPDCDPTQDDGFHGTDLLHSSQESLLGLTEDSISSMDIDLNALEKVSMYTLSQSFCRNCSLPTILQVGVQGSSPQLLSILINVVQSCLFSKHLVSRTSFSDVFFPFRWLSMLSSHLSLDLPLGLFPFIFNVITTMSIDSSSLLVTWTNHRSLFLLIT